MANEIHLNGGRYTLPELLECVVSQEPAAIIQIVEDQTNYQHLMKKAYLSVLHLHGGNQANAAKSLSMPRTTFRDKLHKYGVL